MPSSVETRAKSQFFQGLPAINVSIAVIFTAFHISVTGPGCDILVTDRSDPPERGRSSVWLERRPVTSEVAGSSPVVPAIFFPNFSETYAFDEPFGQTWAN